MEKSINKQYLRLKNVADKHFGNLSQLAEKLDKKPSTFHSYKYKEFGHTILFELQKKFNISKLYIEEGILPELLNEQYNEINNVYPKTFDFHIISSIANYTFTISKEPVGKMSIYDLIKVEEGIIFSISTNYYEKYNIMPNDYVIVTKSLNIFPNALIVFKSMHYEPLSLEKIKSIDNDIIVFADEQPIKISEIEIVGCVKTIIRNLC